MLQALQSTRGYKNLVRFLTHFRPLKSEPQGSLWGKVYWEGGAPGSSNEQNARPGRSKGGGHFHGLVVLVKVHILPGRPASMVELHARICDALNRSQSPIKTPRHKKLA